MEGRKSSRWVDLRLFLTGLFRFQKSNETLLADALPDETWLHVFKYFKSQKELMPIKLTCKRFANIASDSHLVQPFDNIQAIAVSPSHDLMAIAINKNVIVVRKLDGSHVAALRSKGEERDEDSDYRQILFTKENQYIVAIRTHDYMDFEVWDIASQTLKYRKTREDFTCFKGLSLTSFHILSNARLLMAVSQSQADTRLHILDLETEEIVKEMPCPFDAQEVDTLCVSHDEELLMLCHNKKLYQTKLYPPENENICYKSWNLPEECHHYQFLHILMLAGEKVFICVEVDEQVNIFVLDQNSSEMKKLDVSYGGSRMGLRIDFDVSPDGRFIAFFDCIEMYSEHERERERGIIHVYDTQTNQIFYQEPCSLGIFKLRQPVFFIGNDKILIAQHDNVYVRALPNLALREEENQVEERRLMLRN